jgi:hypothetical protein
VAAHCSRALNPVATPRAATASRSSRRSRATQRDVAPPTGNRAFTISADLVLGQGRNGCIVARGSAGGGYVLSFVKAVWCSTTSTSTSTARCSQRSRCPAADARPAVARRPGPRSRCCRPGWRAANHGLAVLDSGRGKSCAVIVFIGGQCGNS